MNSKALKQKLEFPPQLNLSNDRPHIDNSFTNVEKNNAPLLNDMLQPIYAKNLGKTVVYDNKGNAYYISGTSLVKEDSNGDISTVINDIDLNHFEREELKGNYIAYDISDYNEAYLKREGSYYYFKYGDNTIESSLEGVIINARCRILNNIAIFVLYIDLNNIEYTQIYTLREDGTLSRVLNKQAAWYMQSISKSLYTVTIPDASPVINMAYTNGLYCISLVHSTGLAMACTETGFITLLSSDLTTWKQIGPDLTLNWGSTATSVTSTIKDNLSCYYTYSNNVSEETYQVFVYAGTVRYYTSSLSAPGDAAICTLISSSYLTDNLQIGTAILDGTGYKLYKFTRFIHQVVYTIKGSSNYWYTITKFHPGITNIEGGPFSAKNREGINGTVINDPDTDPSSTILVANNTSRTQGQTTISLRYWNFSGQATPTPYIQNYSGTTLTVYEAEGSTVGYSVEINLSYFNVNRPYEVTYSGGPTIQSYDGIIMPCIVLDSGSFHPIWRFSTPTTTNVGRGKWVSPINGSVYNYGYNPVISGSTFKTTNGANVNFVTNLCPYIRSNSFIVNQNLYIATVKSNNSDAALPYNLSSDGKETSGAKFMEWTYSNVAGLRYAPGTTRMTNYNYYSKAVYGDPTLTGAGEDLEIFTVAGYRSSIENSKFNILYNTFLSGYNYQYGLSYSSASNKVGTLVANWGSINENNYITANKDTLIYKANNNKWYKITLKERPILYTILSDRVIVVNCSSYLNSYDSELERPYHYASDYNGRLFHGSNSVRTFSGTIKTGINTFSGYNYLRYTGNAINPLYNVQPRYIVSSLITPIIARYRCYVGEETIINSLVDEYQDALGVDVFYSDQNQTACKYKFTIIPGSATTKYKKSQYENLNYPGSTSSSNTLSPSILSEYIKGGGNNDLIIENYSAYTLTYNDTKPVLVFSASTQVSNLYDSNTAFFVIQGQYYGVMGQKLYSLTYSSGVISSMDAIIDLGDMYFIGNNPMVAYFYDKATKVIRCFTGDANLQTLFNASKISEYYKYWYDYTTQTIFVATDAGLLALGPRNNYLHENWKNVTNCQFSTDGVSHITNNGETINVKYYSDDDYEVVPVDLETSFYGLGNTELTNIDRWNITLYDIDGNKKSSYITVGIRSITDISVKSEEKTIKITPDMYDSWSNSVLISYTPAMQKAQGLRLYVKTPLAIQSIVAHVSDGNTGTLTRNGL